MTLDSLHAPGNATHGFMDFMLMMGVAGEGVKADHADSLDLFHTMEAYFTWYPEGRGWVRVSQARPARAAARPARAAARPAGQRVGEVGA